MEEHNDRMIGRIFDKYQIQEVLGRGGMGVVYRAHDTSLDRDVAIKMMDILIAGDPNFLRRFQSEARALAKLNDPNIVSVFSLLETPEGIGIVMEFVRGRTLSDLLKETPLLPVARVLGIFRQVFAALDHAHRGGVIHRDIKPGNVMLTAADVVKVTDFGLAKIQTPDGTTMTKGTAGTLLYMSPEQIRGIGQVDQRGDIYSAAMALYECLAGGLPFPPDASDYVVANMIVEGNVPPPDTINRLIPQGLTRIVMTAINKDPDRRYQSASEVLSALQQFSGGTGAPEFAARTGPGSTQGVNTATVVSTASLVRPSPAGKYGWRVPVSLLGVALAAGLAYVALRAPSGTAAGIQNSGSVVPTTRGSDAKESAGSTAVDPKVLPKPAAECLLTLVAIPDGEAAVDDSAFRSVRAPLTLGVGPGTRRVRFRGGKGITKEKSVEVRPGVPGTVRCYFQGSVHVEATLDYISAPVAIVVDGVSSRVMTPARIALPAGKHRIGVRMENYVSLPAEELVTVEPSFDSPPEYKITFRMKRGQ